MRKSKLITNQGFRHQLFNYARQFSAVAWLDTHSFVQKYGSASTIVALGVKSELKTNVGNAFEELDSFLKVPKWAFGFLAYDLKNELETGLQSRNQDGLSFPDLYFFEPEVLLVFQGDEVEIQSDNERLIEQILALNRAPVNAIKQQKSSKVGASQLKARMSKQEYLLQVQEIKKRIARGDVYEMNFCHEFYQENTKVDPFELHERLMKSSPTPFSSFLKLNDHYVSCASPERFLKKKGTQVLSQPIKGTTKRGRDQQEDNQLKKLLAQNPKERSENVMIVDLVRNDLSQVASDASVKVEELCQIYSFSQVHQMISTVSCEVNKGVVPLEIIKNCFPMGSMTGAPKLKAMELIEEYEQSKRGVYSGSVGYFTPEGDFDFNVVIRSILYHAKNQFLSFSVGGAITHHSQPEQEYEETLLKAQGILEALNSPQN